MSPILRRPEPSEYAPRYASYMELVPETDIIAALAAQADETAAFLAAIPCEMHGCRYAEGKWSIREVVGHLSDTERIFGFRVLCFARCDQNRVWRADENLYASTGEFDRLPLAELAGEFAAARHANVELLKHLPDAAWDRRGNVSDVSISVRGVAYLTLAHERHHLDILRTRYLKA